MTAARERAGRFREPFVPFGRTAIVVQLVLAVIVLGYVLVNQGVQLPFGVGSSEFTLRAEFHDGAGLNPGFRPPVLVAGMVVGRVTGVSYQHGEAVATLQLDAGVQGHIHADATAGIFPHSELNDLEVDVSPGTPGAPLLRAGGLIPASNTSSPVALDRVLGVLDADSRAYLQIMLNEASVGLRDRSGSLSRALQALGPTLDSTNQVAAAMAERHTLLSGMVGAFDRLFTTLGQRDSELARAISAGRTTLQTVGTQDTALAQGMQELPATLDSTRTAFSSVQSLAAPLDTALDRLIPFSHTLPGALSSLRRIVPTGNAFLAQLSSLARRGVAPANALAGALRQLGPTATHLQPAVADLLPTLSAINANKSGIGEIGSNFSGIFSTSDALGVRLRAFGFFEPVNLADLGFSSTASPAQTVHDKLLAVTALTRICQHTNVLACLIRYLVPGLPGSVRSIAQPAGDPAAALRKALGVGRP
jgi:phospholipid/cholesterol/gamma-HCH transport system substrate-binding protein